MLEQQSDDIRATLAISSAEALKGTTRTLTLPGGRQVSIPIPAGTQDGQEIHLAGQGLTSSRGGLAGALILTIIIVSANQPVAPSYSQTGSDFPTEFGSAPGVLSYPHRANNLPTEISSVPLDTTSYPQKGNDFPTEIKSLPPPPPPQTYPGLPSTDPGGTFTPPYPFQTELTYPPQPQLYERPQPAVQASPQQSRGLSRGVTILLAILVLLLIGAGGLIYYLTVFQRAQTQNQATATAQVNATSSAQVAATGQANATLTAAAQTNIQATTTASALQTSYSQATSGTPAINDPLSQQDSNNWDQSANCAFAGGAYHGIIPQQNTFVSCSPNTASATFSNFALQVQMTITKGDYGGMLFRSNSTGVNYYFLSIDQTGFYSLVVYKNDKQIKTLSSGTSSAFKTGLNQPNVITVVAQGSNLSLYINGLLATKTIDNTYMSGDIALIAGDATHSTDVAFSNMKVWNL